MEHPQSHGGYLFRLDSAMKGKEPVREIPLRTQAPAVSLEPELADLRCWLVCSPESLQMGDSSVGGSVPQGTFGNV